MEKTLYAEMAELEGIHWWFRGRQAIVMDVVKRFCGKGQGKLLDIGLGTGHNAALFERIGFEVTGVEPSLDAIAIARRKAPRTRILNVPFPSNEIPEHYFSVISMLDSLEHLKDDAGALRAALGALAPGGHIIVTVPAFSFLWSSHDESAHHYRRYRKDGLVKLLKDAGFEVEMASYYNFFLFPAIVLVRILGKAKGSSQGSDFARTPQFLNGLLANLFGAERFLLRLFSLPFGVSIVAVAKAR